MMKVHKVRTKTLLLFLGALSASGFATGFATGFEELGTNFFSVLGGLDLDSEG